VLPCRKIASDKRNAKSTPLALVPMKPAEESYFFRLFDPSATMLGRRFPADGSGLSSTPVNRSTIRSPSVWATKFRLPIVIFILPVSNAPTCVR
jgi:hypothetical protein